MMNRTFDNLSPVADELDVADLPVTGRLPPGLDGVLLRNGPNPQFETPGAHWFHGDGMIHAFTLRDGRASYRNRWIRTTRFLAEQRAERALDRIENDQGRANTNIVFHAGQLMALEEAHAPVALSLRTLEPLVGAPSGQVGRPFTAHPKRDPRTGELLFFGYASRGPFSTAIRCGGIGADSREPAWEIEFEAPFMSMIHDFAITERFLIIPVLPLAGSLDRAEHGQPPYMWEPSLGARLAIVRRNSAAPPIWLDVPVAYVFHVINAWEEENVIQIDLLQYDAPPLFPRADQPAADERQGATAWRWSLRLDGAAPIGQRQLDNLVGEFPRIDERRMGLSFRFSWLACRNPDHPNMAFNALSRLDHIELRHSLFTFASDDQVSEPVFVPRTADAREGEGWLLAVRWAAGHDASDLLVFDAADLPRGPIASVGLPRRVPAGFHGNWLDRAAPDRGIVA